MNQKFNLSDYPLWTALITPFNQNDEIDFVTLKALVADQEQANNGILLLGSTGEGLALTSSEHKSIVDYICQLAPGVPLMVAVGGSNLKQQLEWISYCNELPISAYLLGSPLYAKPGVVGQTQWFDSLLTHAKSPCMLYNVPGRSAVEIAPEVVKNLTHHQNLWAMKEASGEIAKFEAFRNAAPELAIFSGDDALLPYFAQAGAKGLVSVAANAWPSQTAEFVRRALSGTSPNLFKTWTLAVNSLFSVANPIPVKVLMHQQNRLPLPDLRPPLTHKELSSMAEIKAANTSILAWT